VGTVVPVRGGELRKSAKKKEEQREKGNEIKRLRAKGIPKKKKNASVQGHHKGLQGELKEKKRQRKLRGKSGRGVKGRNHCNVVNNARLIPVPREKGGGGGRKRRLCEKKKRRGG